MGLVYAYFFKHLSLNMIISFILIKKKDCKWRTHNHLETLSIRPHLNLWMNAFPITSKLFNTKGYYIGS